MARKMICQTCRPVVKNSAARVNAWSIERVWVVMKDVIAVPAVGKNACERGKEKGGNLGGEADEAEEKGGLG